jgi:hypothetical protein
MSDAGPAAAEARPLGRQALTLVLHCARQTEKCILPPFVALKRMGDDSRLSLLEKVVKGALKINSVPQLRLGSNKAAAVFSLDSLAHCFYDEADLQAAGFSESGELHLYVDKPSSSSSSSSSRQQQVTLHNMPLSTIRLSQSTEYLLLLQVMAVPSKAVAVHLHIQLAV